MTVKRKVLLSAVVGAVLFAATVITFRDAVLFAVIGAFIGPNHEFADRPPAKTTRLQQP
jgi:hypothetical protein